MSKWGDTWEPMVVFLLGTLKLGCWFPFGDMDQNRNKVFEIYETLFCMSNGSGHSAFQGWLVQESFNVLPSNLWPERGSDLQS